MLFKDTGIFFGILEKVQERFHILIQPESMAFTNHFLYSTIQTNSGWSDDTIRPLAEEAYESSQELYINIALTTPFYPYESPSVCTVFFQWILLPVLSNILIVCHTHSLYGNEAVHHNLGSHIKC